MAPIILYNFDPSPPCFLVRVIAEILGLDLKKIPIKDITKEMAAPEMTKKNPQRTVPTVDDNGLYLAESRAIAAYLISKYGKNDSLYPKDLTKRVLVDQRLYFDFDVYKAFEVVWHRIIKIKGAEMLLKGLVFIHDNAQQRIVKVTKLLQRFSRGIFSIHRSVPDLLPAFPALLAKSFLGNNEEAADFFGGSVPKHDMDRLTLGLETLNRMLEGKEWLALDHISLADYSAAATMAALQYILHLNVDLSKYGNITRWLSRVENSFPKYAELKKVYSDSVVALVEEMNKQKQAQGK